MDLSPTRTYGDAAGDAFAVSGGRHMDREQISHRAPGRQSSTGSRDLQQLAPGKRTLTEGLAVQRRAAGASSGSELAAGGTAASGPLAHLLPPSDGARPTLQMLFGGLGAAAGERRDEALPSDGGGQPMPRDVRAKMESGFGADFSQVRIHEGSRAPALGARAYAQGTDIHFAPGAYQPQSPQGQELLGHELTHVVQQSQGRVQATTQAKGVDVNDDSSLEREADEMGARAARDEPVGGAPGGKAVMTGAAQRAPVQRVLIGPDGIETIDPQNRSRVLAYLRTIAPQELMLILQHMQQENHRSNREYIQIITKMLARDGALNQIDDITHQRGGVWTSATVFYEKQPVHSTQPAQAGGHDAPDHYGFGVHEDHESSMSISDSEVSTIAQLEQYLPRLLSNGVHTGRRVDLLITGNMGPCDGCKTRFTRFLATCRATWQFVNFELEVNYTTPPNDVRRGGQDTTYGDHNDGSRVSPSNLRYYHNTQ